MEWFVSQSKVNFKALGRVCVWLIEKEFDEYKLSMRDKDKKWSELEFFSSVDEAKEAAEALELEHNLTHPEEEPPADMALNYDDD